MSESPVFLFDKQPTYAEIGQAICDRLVFFQSQKDVVQCQQEQLLFCIDVVQELDQHGKSPVVGEYHSLTIAGVVLGSVTLQLDHLYT